MRPRALRLGSAEIETCPGSADDDSARCSDNGALLHPGHACRTAREPPLAARETPSSLIPDTRAVSSALTCSQGSIESGKHGKTEIIDGSARPATAHYAQDQPNRSD